MRHFDGVKLAIRSERLAALGNKVTGGTIVDATIIAKPSSTKNEAKARHQTRKGQQCISLAAHEAAGKPIGG